MGAPGFDAAYASARRTYSDQTWFSFTPAEQTSAIYQELRRLDREWAVTGTTVITDALPDALARVA